MAKKFEFSKFIVIVLLLFALVLVTCSYLNASRDLDPNADVTVKVVEMEEKSIMAISVWGLLAIVGTVLVFVVGISVVMQAFMRKGISLGVPMEIAEQVVGELATAFPDNLMLTLLDCVVQYAAEAVKAAEQLYKSNQITAQERKETATQLVYDFIRAAGIDITDEIKNIVSGCIEAAVLILPKTTK